MKRTLKIKGMSCASCAGSIESILDHKNGVLTASVNFATNKLLLEIDESVVTLEEVKAEVQSVGYDLLLNEEERQDESSSDESSMVDYYRKHFIGALLFTFPVFIISMFFMEWEAGRWISMFLSLPVLAWFGRGFFQNAWKQAKHFKTNMDSLVALSTGVAFSFSVWSTIYPWLNSQSIPSTEVYFEAATVIIVFILLGKWLEEKAKAKTHSSIKNLIGLQPKTLVAIKGNEQIEMPISEAKVGLEIIIKPGDKIPVDGVLSSGSSLVNERLITGEPVAVEKVKGDKVYAGSINQQGSFHFIAEKVGAETLLAQIITMVEQAQGSKAPVQKLADKIASIFVPTILAISLLTAVAWLVFGGENAGTFALLNAVAVLVIACPCALGLATPTAIMVGMGVGANNNILIKDAESLEVARNVTDVVLDKTGTITEGKPSVTSQKWFNQDDNKHPHLAGILLALELKSEHPLATAIVSTLKEQGITAGIIETFNSVTGNGITGTDQSGQYYYVGNQDLLEKNQIAITETIAKTVKEWQSEAKTVIYFANSTEVLAIFGITDKIKSTSISAVKKLKEMGIRVSILTGDHPKSAHFVAEKLGIVSVYAGLKPSEKAKHIQDLQEEGKVVAMVGDGINDSHAMAQADLSIAMAHGADIAIDVAKMTLITSDLNALPSAITLSHKTMNGVKQNLFWAFIYNLIGIPIAAGLLFPINGFLLNPMFAGAAMALSSVSVVLNSLRLKYMKIGWEIEDSAQNKLITKPLNESNMKTLVFKTNINCNGCIAGVTPTLNNLEGVEKWDVDLTSNDRILKIETNTLDEKTVESAIEKAGFKAEAVYNV
jgi:Cu2+-exporting ATPase